MPPSADERALNADDDGSENTILVIRTKKWCAMAPPGGVDGIFGTSSEHFPTLDQLTVQASGPRASIAIYKSHGNVGPDRKEFTILIGAEK